VSLSSASQLKVGSTELPCLTDAKQISKRLLRGYRTPIIQTEAESVVADVLTYVRSETKRLRDGYHGKRLYVKSDALEMTIVRTLTERRRACKLRGERLAGIDSVTIVLCISATI
jgi:hypothetical protein